MIWKFRDLKINFLLPFPNPQISKFPNLQIETRIPERNNNQPASKPTQVGALTTWSKINLSGGGSQNAGAQMVRPCAAAIKTDGTLWTWGDNNQGTLGRGNVITPIRSPVQVGTATDWTSVTCGTLSLNAGGVGGSMFAIRTT